MQKLDEIPTFVEEALHNVTLQEDISKEEHIHRCMEEPYAYEAKLQAYL
jgi:hypothetical protein